MLSDNEFETWFLWDAITSKVPKSKTKPPWITEPKSTYNVRIKNRNTKGSTIRQRVCMHIMSFPYPFSSDRNLRNLYENIGKFLKRLTSQKITSTVELKGRKLLLLLLLLCVCVFKRKQQHLNNNESWPTEQSKRLFKLAQDHRHCVKRCLWEERSNDKKVYNQLEN